MAPVRYIVDTAAADGLILTHSRAPRSAREAAARARLSLHHLRAHRARDAASLISTTAISISPIAPRTSSSRAGGERIMIVLPPAPVHLQRPSAPGLSPKRCPKRCLQPCIAEATSISILAGFAAARLCQRGSRRRAQPPDGIICGSELQALGMMLGFQEPRPRDRTRISTSSTRRRATSSISCRFRPFSSRRIF